MSSQKSNHHHFHTHTQSLTYLEKVYQYKEVWPEAKIHEAYQQASGSWDDTIDILTQES